MESVETVLSFGIPLYTVIGNADIEGNGRVFDFKLKSLSQIF